SLLELMGGDGVVLGIDIDIRAHNRAEIEKHPMAKRIRLFQGSSVDASAVAEARKHVAGGKRVMVVLDSNHTHEHVLKELELYAPLVTKDSYMVVMDTDIEDMPTELFHDRPCRKGTSPKSPVHAYLATNRRFTIDKDIESKLLI